MSGDKLDEFELLKKLGSGAYSSVYNVRRVVDDKEYALKKVRLDVLSEKEQENAVNEVRILASVDHPNVVQYKDVFVDKPSNSLCIVMEFANNGDLYQKIVEHEEDQYLFTEQEIWKLLIQVISGLKALHEIKIMHRDIKVTNTTYLLTVTVQSANVFLNKDWTVKLGDMNVSKKADQNGLNFTQTGTPYYASPEVWKDEPYSIKADIWSVGCIIYEMATLKPPFQAEDMQGLYRKVIRGQIKALPKEYSNDLAQMVKILLQVKAENRPTCEQIMAMPIFAQRAKKFFPDIFNYQENQLMKTITFTNREKIMMGSDQDIFMSFLQKKLPLPNYENQTRFVSKSISSTDNKRRMSKNFISSDQKKSSLALVQTKITGQKSVQSPRSKLKVVDSVLSQSELTSSMPVKEVRNSGSMVASPNKIKRTRKKSQVNIRLQQSRLASSSQPTLEMVSDIIRKKNSSVNPRHSSPENQGETIVENSYGRYSSPHMLLDSTKLPQISSEQSSPYQHNNSNKKVHLINKKVINPILDRDNNVATPGKASSLPRQSRQVSPVLPVKTNIVYDRPYNYHSAASRSSSLQTKKPRRVIVLNQQIQQTINVYSPNPSDYNNLHQSESQPHSRFLYGKKMLQQHAALPKIKLPTINKSGSMQAIDNKQKIIDKYRGHSHSSKNIDYGLPKRYQQMPQQLKIYGSNHNTEKRYSPAHLQPISMNYIHKTKVK